MKTKETDRDNIETNNIKKPAKWESSKKGEATSRSVDIRSRRIISFLLYSGFWPVNLLPLFSGSALRVDSLIHPLHFYFAVNL